MAVCVLRFANILGPSADSPLASYFSLPVLPTVLGYDPRLQFVHEDDVIEVLRIASHEPARGTLNSGTFNIAGDGVLLLSQCARRLGRPTVPLVIRGNAPLLIGRDDRLVTLVINDPFISRTHAAIVQEDFNEAGVTLRFSVPRGAVDELALTVANITRGRAGWEVE